MKSGRAAEAVFECYADDGRTYILRLDAEDVDALRGAGLTRAGQCKLGLDGEAKPIR